MYNLHISYHYETGLESRREHFCSVNTLKEGKEKIIEFSKKQIYTFKFTNKLIGPFCKYPNYVAEITLLELNKKILIVFPNKYFIILKIIGKC